MEGCSLYRRFLSLMGPLLEFFAHPAEKPGTFEHVPCTDRIAEDLVSMFFCKGCVLEAPRKLCCTSCKNEPGACLVGRWRPSTVFVHRQV